MTEEQYIEKIESIKADWEYHCDYVKAAGELKQAYNEYSKSGHYACTYIPSHLWDWMNDCKDALKVVKNREYQKKWRDTHEQSKNERIRLKHELGLKSVKELDAPKKAIKKLETRGIAEKIKDQCIDSNGALDIKKYNRLYQREYRKLQSNKDYQRKFQNDYQKKNRKITVARVSSGNVCDTLGLKHNSNWQIHHIFGNGLKDAFVVLPTKKHVELHSLFGKENPKTMEETLKQLAWVKENVKHFNLVRNGVLVSIDLLLEGKSETDLF